MGSTALARGVAADGASARDIAPAGAGAPVKLFAWLGAGWVLLLAYVFARWLGSSYIAMTAPGPDVPPRSTLVFIRCFEVASVLTTLWLLWECVVKPLLREGELGTDGLFVLTWVTLWFHDPMMNWTVHVFSYNSYAFNLGTWTSEIPGWLSPRSHLMPEPLLAIGSSYIALCTSAAWACLYLMEYVKRRRPRTTNLQLICVGLGCGMFLDWACEHALIALQLMSYLSTVPALSLCAGKLYQFPLYEAVFFGGVVGFTGVVVYFRDDRGLTWAERGLERLQVARRRGMKTVVRWLALMGLFHTVMFFFYSVPVQLFAINGGPFPPDVPSYLRNGVCGEGTPYPCAAPDVPIPRRMKEGS